MSNLRTLVSRAVTPQSSAGAPASLPPRVASSDATSLLHRIADSLERIDRRVAVIEESVGQKSGTANATPTTLTNGDPVQRVVPRDQSGRERHVILAFDAPIIVSPQRSTAAGGIDLGAGDSPFDFGELPPDVELFASRAAGATGAVRVVAFVSTV